MLNLSSGHGKPLHFLQGLPDGYRGRLLPGAYSATCIEDFGTIIQQEIQSVLFRIAYVYADLKKPTSIEWQIAEPEASSCFALQNELLKIIPGIGRIKMKPGQVYYQPKGARSGTLVYEQPEIYQSLYTGYGPDLHKGLPQPARKGPQWVGPDLLQWIDAIFTEDVTPELRQQYYEIKIKASLLLQVGKVYSKLDKTRGMLPHVRAAVYETLDIIRRDMKVHFTIDELAEMIGLDNFHLRKNFKIEMGMGIYEYQLWRKMNEARRLLLETDMGEKEIAAILGYSAVSPFSTAFHRYFDVRPKDLREQDKKSRDSSDSGE